MPSSSRNDWKVSTSCVFVFNVVIFQFMRLVFTPDDFNVSNDKCVQTTLTFLLQLTVHATPYTWCGLTGKKSVNTPSFRQVRCSLGLRSALVEGCYFQHYGIKVSILQFLYQRGWRKAGDKCFRCEWQCWGTIQFSNIIISTHHGPSHY